MPIYILIILTIYQICSKHTCQPFSSFSPHILTIYHITQNVRSFKKLCKPTYTPPKMWIMWISRCIIPFHRFFQRLYLWITCGYFVSLCRILQKYLLQFCADFLYISFFPSPLTNKTIQFTDNYANYLISVSRYDTNRFPAASKSLLLSSGPQKYVSVSPGLSKIRFP